MIMDFLKCNICFSKYNETTQRPRSLSCGHTFCESCLNATVENKILVCPRCRKKHCVNSVCDIPVNFDLEGILKTLNPSSEEQNEGAISKQLEEKGYSAKSKIKGLGSLKSLLDQKEISLAAQKELLKSSAGMCNEHQGNEFKFRCSLHKSWVCEKCIHEQGDHPRSKCNIISFKEEIDVRKQEYKKSLDNEVKICDVSLSTIDTHIAHLKDEIENHVCLANKLHILLKLHRMAEEKLQKKVICFQNDRNKGRNLRRSLSAVESTNLNSETLDESNTARENVKSKTTEAKNWRNLSLKKIEAGMIVIERSAFFVMTTKKMLEFKENCFEIQESDIIQQNYDLLKPTDMSDNKINSRYINLLRKNLNMVTHLYKDQLHDVTKSTNNLFNFEELITKVQLALLGLVYKIDNNTEDHKYNTWAINMFNEDGMVRAAPITTCNGRFVLHSLKSYHSLPPMAIKLSYEHVRKLYNPASLVFLDICNDHNHIGTIKIELFTQNPRGKAMLNYCTGEKGWSYVDASFQTYEDCNFVGFSDFTNFPSSLEQEFECLKTAREVGIVTPVYDNGVAPINDCSFGVILQESPHRVDGFGLVVAGLSFMKNLEKDDCHISDCGIII